MCGDRLEALLHHFPVQARVFHAGALCGITPVPGPDGSSGQMHLVRSGRVEVVHPGRRRVQIKVPSVLLYPKPVARHFVTDPERGADLVCAEVRFEGGPNNPLVAALPEVLHMPLAGISGIETALTLLFEEAFRNNCGRQAVIDRLFEVVLVQLLRHLMEAGVLRGGMLAGLSDPALRKALVAMHEQPQHAWTLETLAATAGLSRSGFAASFQRVVGTSPGKYLQVWRMQLAKRALIAGRPLKQIAADVGYGSEVALSRAFKLQHGQTTREWRLAQQSFAGRAVSEE